MNTVDALLTTYPSLKRIPDKDRVRETALSVILERFFSKF